MFEALKHWHEERLAKRMSTDFGALPVLEEAENKSRLAHDNLMNELARLRSQLDGSDRRHNFRRRTDWTT